MVQTCTRGWREFLYITFFLTCKENFRSSLFKTITHIIEKNTTYNENNSDKINALISKGTLCLNQDTDYLDNQVICSYVRFINYKKKIHTSDPRQTPLPLHPSYPTLTLCHWNSHYNHKRNSNIIFSQGCIIIHLCLTALYEIMPFIPMQW